MTPVTTADLPRGVLEKLCSGDGWRPAPDQDPEAQAWGIVFSRSHARAVAATRDDLRALVIVEAL